MNFLTVEVPEDPTIDELREAAIKADRIAALHEAEARAFRNLSTHLWERVVRSR